MELAEFDYALPAELIAQAPLPDRSAFCPAFSVRETAWC
jgi:S-adenosylmethionine:tRNA-ribosyltransferase-isomerase (queuine synthetase)